MARRAGGAEGVSQSVSILHWSGGIGRCVRVGHCVMDWGSGVRGSWQMVSIWVCCKILGDTSVLGIVESGAMVNVG